MARVAVVGAGIFGITGALELARRGHDVTVFDQGAIPHPLAASTDVSKVVRLDYGTDDFYVAEMERALQGWHTWNTELRETVFHRSGAMFVTREPMAPDGFEHASFELLQRRGHRLERLERKAIESRSSLRGFVDGYFNPDDGWADSSRVIERLTALVRSVGVQVRENAKLERVSRGELGADLVVVAAGSWTPYLLPEMAGAFRTVGQPVFHVEAPESVRLPVFAADLAKTGWYGFPPRDGFVKLAVHGAGRPMHPESSEREVTADEERALRDLLRDALPMLADAPLRKTRVCLYCDTADEHFWIAPHPDDPRLIVASGGSGHAFKFAPRIGEWIARALEGDVIPRFRWREGGQKADQRR